jgi:hypothetical protein
MRTETKRTKNLLPAPPRRGHLLGEEAKRAERNMRGFTALCDIELPAGKQPNTLMPNGLDRTDYYMYDTFTVAANTAFPNKTAMFTTPQQGSTKNLAQTDMDSFGQLVAPEIMVVRAMRVYVLNNVTPTDLLALYTNVSVIFNIGKKPLWKGVPWQLPAGGGLWLQGAQVGTAPAGSSVLFTASNGNPDIRNVYSLRDPHTINAGENFSVIFTAETAFNTQAVATNPPGTGFTIVMALEGSLFQAVR